QNALTLTAVTDFTTPAGGNTGKSIILTANQSIADLSIYGLGTANNGGGTDGQEYTFPAISVSAGEHILLCRDSAALSNYFDGAMEQFPGALLPTRIIENVGSSVTSNVPDGNGNDAVELYENSVVIETYGDITWTKPASHTGSQSSYYDMWWGYLDSWAFKQGPSTSGTHPAFTATSNANWLKVVTACILGDGNAGAAQTLTINVTSLPTGGANARKLKTLANGTFNFSPAIALTLGLNTFTVPAPASPWGDRAVKFQFDSDAIEFDNVTLNGTVVYDQWLQGGIDCSDGSPTTAQSSCPFPMIGSYQGSSSPLSGTTWKLVPFKGSLAVGPTQSEIGNWWQNDHGAVGLRGCLFDDSIQFNADGTMMHYMDGSTWLEGWQAGSPAEGCGTPIAPHDGGSATWGFANDELTVSGSGAHIGLAKVHNGGEDGMPVNNQITYDISLSADGNIMTADINYGGGWWRFVYQKTNTQMVTPSVTYQVDTSGIGVPIDASGMKMAGNFGDLGATTNGVAMNSWDPGNANSVMTDIGNGKWEITVDYPSRPIGYTATRQIWKFVNGNWGGDETQVTSPYCGGLGGFGNDRFLDFSESTIRCYDWNSCNSCLPACSYTFNAYDSFGDSWNGHTVDVLVNGVAVVTAATVATSFDAFPFQASTGDVIEVTNWVQGSFGSEVSWDITNTDGTIILSGGAMDVGTVTGTCPTCDPVSAISTTSVDTNSIDITWMSGGLATAWNVEYGLVGFNQGTGTIAAVTDTNYSVTGLAAGTTYDFYVQADCGSGEVGIWVGPLSATTSGTCGTYTLDLFDSNSDGWGTGAGIDIVKNGTTILSTTLVSGGFASFTIQTNIGDTLDFVYLAPTSFSGENSYKVHDQNGIEIIHQGAGNATPNSVSSYVSCASCPAPVQVNASNVTSSTADLVWYGFSASTFNVQYGLVGYTPIPGLGDSQSVGNGTIIAVDDTNYTIIGLAGATTYDFWVRTDCIGDSSSYAGPFTFETLIPSPQGITCSTGAQYDFLPGNVETGSGWTGISASGNQTWRLGSGGTPSGSTGPSGPNSGTGYFYFEATGSAFGANGTAVSPMVDLSTASGSAELSFYLHAYGADIGTIDVGIGSSVSGPFTSAFNYTGQIQTTSTDPWTPVGVDLTSYIGQQIYIAFNYVDGGGYQADIAIDSINIAACATCPGPTALTATGITSNSANLIWTSNALSTGPSIAEYGVSGFSIGSGMSGNASGVDIFAISGLNPDTDYDFYVKSDCGADSSIYAGPFTFTTACGVNASPYLEDFDGGLSPCWTNNTTDALDWSANSGGTPSSSTGPSDDVTGGGNYIYVETSGSSAGDSAMLTTGDIDISALTSPALRMYTHMLGGSMGELSVWITDASGTMTQIFIKNGEEGDLWVPVYIDLSAYSGTVNFTLLYVNSATTDGTAWQGDCSIDNFEVMELPSCIDPYGLSASNVLSTTSDISWSNPSSTVNSWNYVYDTAGFDPLLGTPVSTSNTTVSLTGLSYDTAYDFYVQSACGTSWIGPLNFTTLPDAGTCGFFTVDLLDSFGDSWNGNALIVNVNGVLYDTLTVASGFNAQNFIPSDIGDVLDFNYVIDAYATGANTYPSENSYTVTNSSGIVVANATYDAAIATVPSILGVTACPPNDLYAYAAIVPSGCDLSTTESLEFWIVNTGTVAESAFDVAYVANGGTQIIESITSTLNPSDTLKHVFATTVDMSVDGMYTVDFAVILSTDFVELNNTLSVDAENYLIPAAPTTAIGDTICNGDTAMVSADADYIFWYDAAIGGNFVGEGVEIEVIPVSTTSYYAEAIAEAVAVEGHSEDFDSYTSGGFIVASDPNNWAVWPGGGAAVDMPITDVHGNGGNSLRVFNSDGTDVVMEFGEAFSTGKFYYSMDMYMVGDGYINFQEDVVVGTTWNMSITFIGGVIDIEIDGASVLTGSYTSTDPAGNTVWNTFEFECDYSTGTWEVFADGVSQGTFVNADPVASVNIYPGAGVEYYLDNVEWYAYNDDVCRSTSRTEAVVTVNSPTSGIDVQTACDSLTWIDGVTYTASNNTATHILTNSIGCDSIVTLDLIINYSTTGNDVITTCDSYTWIDGITYTSSNNSATYTIQNNGSSSQGIQFDINSPSSILGPIGFSTNADPGVSPAGWTLTPNLNSPSNSINAELMMVEDGTSGINPEGNPISQEGCYPLINDLTGKIAVIWRNTCQFGEKILNAERAGAIGAIIINRLPGLINMAPADSGYLCTIPAIFIENVDGAQLVNEMQNGPVTAFIGTIPNGNAVGCDSVVTLDLTINYPNTGIDTQIACDSLTWIDGITYTSSNNTATHTLTSAAGCDSVVTLDLIINYPNSGTDTQIACDSLTWIDGVTYTSSNNTATYTLTNAVGCDSVVTLDLTINNSSSGTVVINACDSLTWIDGVTYTSSNNAATHTLTNVAGCDSVVTLDLTINYSNSGTDTQTACDSLTWIDGVTYTASNNTATLTLTNLVGCDSVVTLDLIINYSNSGTDIQTTCDSLTWIDGVTYTSSNNTSTYTLTNAVGCDSVVTLDLTIYEFLTDFSESSSLFTGPPFVVQFTNNTPSLTNYNFSWDFGDSTIEQNNNASVFHEYMYNGLYDVTLIAEDITNGCGFDTLKKEDLIYCAGGPNLSIIEFSNNINVFPNPTNENITVSVSNYNGNIQTEVYDLIGNKLQISDENTISLRDYARGIYLLKVTYSDRVDEVKVIKQ
ncbi:choice-of-anchor J domain-containing protein, partial [bacterium]|nr:choice-of-anchor J domain-containing protein [bacterium]